VKLVNKMILDACNTGASDIHIEPFEKKVIVRYRKDGCLYEAMTLPKRMQNNITSRIKIMSKLDIAEKRRPQDGKFQMKIGNKAIDFRVSILPVVWGEKTVFRILDSSNLALDIKSLGFEPRSMEDYLWACRAPYGMILVTGPTGSGKSTTFYSAVRHIAAPDINLVTVEDPVEYQLEGINQVPVNAKQGMTFSGALRSILRQDPDVVLLGEIRDQETLEIAIKAALTGHLVLSTLHTNDAPSTITRMVDMGMDPFVVASSTLLICAQRLGRKSLRQLQEARRHWQGRVDAPWLPRSGPGTADGVLRARGLPAVQQGLQGPLRVVGDDAHDRGDQAHGRRSGPHHRREEARVVGRHADAASVRLDERRARQDQPAGSRVRDDGGLVRGRGFQGISGRRIRGIWQPSSSTRRRTRAASS
jgi:type II secretory ATPase GspE/PulE/Tfp pilus assembly ATPase PilB-like protein